jgi:hypothetical protein
MEGDTLPPELANDPLERIAQRIALDAELSRVRDQCARERRELERIRDEATQARSLARWTAGAGVLMLVLGAALLVFGASQAKTAAADRADAAYLKDREGNAEMGARRHTFGAHFDALAEGWFIDFPPGTAFRERTINGLPAIQVMPHGR